MTDPHTVRGIMGPVGSGKSVGCLMDIVKCAQEQKPGPDGIRHTRFAIVRNTMQQLKDTTLKTWLDWFPDQRAGVWRASDHTFRLKFGDVESEILFRPLDTQEDVKRLLSLELTGAYLNEAREIPYEIFQALFSRIGRYPAAKDEGCTRKSLIFDTNPPDVDHWIYRIFEEQRPDTFALFKQPGGFDPLAENLENLPDRYYEDMVESAKADPKKGQDFIDVHVHAKYGPSKSGKPVWPMYREKMHVAEKKINPVRKELVVIGMDFGRNPAAVFKMQDAWGHVYTIDELWAENMGLMSFLDTKLAPFLSQRYASNEIVIMGDPSGDFKTELVEMTCIGYLKSKGFAAFPAPTNLIEPRIQATEDLLTRLAGDGYPMWLISPHCEHLRKAMRGGYRYKKLKGSDDYSPTPDKKSVYSHIADANQYADMYYTYGLSHRGLTQQLDESMMTAPIVADSGCGY